MEVRVISLGKPVELLTQLKTLYSDVAVHPGVDVRHVSTKSLLAANVITPSVAHTLMHPRKWHHELPSKGAVGLILAIKSALATDVSVPLLLFEDDCMFPDIHKFHKDVQFLMNHLDEFDLAVFGINMKYTMATSDVIAKDWLRVNGYFFRTHCVLYSPKGRQKVHELLVKHPISMQIDSWYGMLANFGHLRIWGQYRNHTAVQSVHVSSIQDVCVLCNISEQQLLTYIVCIILIVVTVVCMVKRGL